jgi:hypothetical protein
MRRTAFDHAEFARQQIPRTELRRCRRLRGKSLPFGRKRTPWIGGRGRRPCVTAWFTSWGNAAG